MPLVTTYVEHDETDLPHPASVTRAGCRQHLIAEENTETAEKRGMLYSQSCQHHPHGRKLQSEQQNLQQRHPTATTGTSNQHQPSSTIPTGTSRHMIRRTIRPSRSKTKLMRQVSALGMEDPVFRTTESGPEHPSNIFEDMGANHIAPDMMDMVSIASDPTAVMGEGCDVLLFQMSLSTPFERGEFLEESSGALATRPSLAEVGGFNQNTGTCSTNLDLTPHSVPFHPHNSNTTRSFMLSQTLNQDETNTGAPAHARHHDDRHVIPLSPDQPKAPSFSSSYHHPTTKTSHLYGILPKVPRKDAFRTTQPNQSSSSTFRGSNSHSFASYQQHLCNRISRSAASTTTEGSEPQSTGTTMRLVPRNNHSDPMNFSLPSLDLEAVFGASSSSHQYYHSATSSAAHLHTTLQRPAATSSPAMFRKRQGSDVGGGSYPTVATTAVATRETSTDTLLTEAAMALEEQGSACIALIEAAKRQHQSQRFNHHENSNGTSTTLSSNQPPSHRVSRRHSIGIFPILETHVESNSADPMTLAGRRLPTMSSLFPCCTTTTTSRVPSRTASSVSSGTRTSSQNSSGVFNRRKSADGDYNSMTTIDTKFQTHQNWNKTNASRAKVK